MSAEYMAGVGDNRSGRLNTWGGAAWPSGLAATLALLPSKICRSGLHVLGVALPFLYLFRFKLSFNESNKTQLNKYDASKRRWKGKKQVDQEETSDIL